MPTLCSDSHGTPHAVAYSFDSLASNSMKSSNPHSGCRQVEVAKTLDTTDPNPSKNQGGIAVVEQYLFENHSQDTRYKGPLDVCPMLPAQLGTGGNNTPFVVEKDAPLGINGDIAGTLDASYYKGCGMRQGVEREVVAVPVYCLQGNGIDRADTAGCNGKGWKEDACYTLNTIDRPAVAYLASGKETVGTLMANAGTKLWLGNQEAFSGDYHIIEEHEPPAVRYIVRRLTPTECARLQGFADRWGEIDPKSDFSDAEYSFWLEVRNTHARINGKAEKEYTKAQMLTWYNKLLTDSAEYKMWGNGIALPPALYCMQGIVDALSAYEEVRGA